jgi:hypothetical protein
MLCDLQLPRPWCRGAREIQFRSVAWRGGVACRARVARGIKIYAMERMAVNADGDKKRRSEIEREKV